MVTTHTLEKLFVSLGTKLEWVLSLLLCLIWKFLFDHALRGVNKNFIKSYKVTNYIVTFNRVLCQMQTRSSFDDHPSPHTHQSSLYVSCLFWTVLIPSAELGREYDPLCLQQRREVLHSERNSVEVRICCMQKRVNSRCLKYPTLALTGCLT